MANTFTLFTTRDFISAQFRHYKFLGYYCLARNFQWQMNVGRIKPLRQQNLLTTTPSWVTELVSAIGNFVLQDSAKSEIYAGNAFFGTYWKIKLEMTNYAKNFRC